MAVFFGVKTMARRTQGSMLWFVRATGAVAPAAAFELVKVGCPLNFKGGTDSKDKIENTCLEEEDNKSYLEGGGLSDTGQSTFDINADPTIASHGMLYDMVGGQGVEWIKGWAGKTKGSVKLIVPELDEDTIAKLFGTTEVKTPEDVRAKVAEIIAESKVENELTKVTDEYVTAAQ